MTKRKGAENERFWRRLRGLREKERAGTLLTEVDREWLGKWSATLRDENHCWFCGREMVTEYGVDCLKKRTLEHLIPLTRGGKHQPGNVVFACKECNNDKSCDTVEEYRERVGAREGYSRWTFFGESRLSVAA